MGAAGLGLGPSGDQVGTGQELQGCGDFQRYEHYPGTNILSLLLGSSKEIVSKLQPTPPRAWLFLIPLPQGSRKRSVWGWGNWQEE